MLMYTISIRVESVPLLEGKIVPHGNNAGWLPTKGSTKIDVCVG